LVVVSVQAVGFDQGADIGVGTGCFDRNREHRRLASADRGVQRDEPPELRPLRTKDTPRPSNHVVACDPTSSVSRTAVPSMAHADEYARAGRRCCRRAVNQCR
jgi:hypothetical protein